VTDHDYRDYASEELNAGTMESITAEAEQGVDMDQAVRHHVYIGWVLGIAKGEGFDLDWQGGNRVALSKSSIITLVIPFPPEDWKP